MISTLFRCQKQMSYLSCRGYIEDSRAKSVVFLSFQTTAVEEKTSENLVKIPLKKQRITRKWNRKKHQKSIIRRQIVCILWVRNNNDHIMNGIRFFIFSQSILIWYQFFCSLSGLVFVFSFLFLLCAFFYFL